MDNSVDKNLIAPCGLNCRLCVVYVENVSLSIVKKEEFCLGCRTQRQIEYNKGLQNGCEIYRCCVEKRKLKFCRECKIHPCIMLPLKSDNKARIKHWLLYYEEEARP